MPVSIDLTNQVFGRLTVLGLSDKRGAKGQRFWDCRCECGEIKPIWVGGLRNGDTRSCGCIKREQTAAMNKTHGMSGHPAYWSWHGMMQRCLNPKHINFDRYGAAGVTVCPEWHDFAGFVKDMGDDHRDGLSIDRIDSKGNYEPSNCRWATKLEQNINRGVSHFINTPKGPMIVTEAARAFGLEARTLFERIDLGWPEDQLLTAARDQETRIETSDGPMTHREAEKKHGLKKGTIGNRIRQGWPDADLLLPTRIYHHQSDRKG